MWKNVVKVQSEPFVNINYSLSINFNVYFIEWTLFYLVKLPNYFEITSTQTPLELICRTDKHASYKSHQHGSDSRWDLTPIIWVIITFNCYSIRKSRNGQEGMKEGFAACRLTSFRSSRLRHESKEATEKDRRNNVVKSFHIEYLTFFRLLCSCLFAVQMPRWVSRECRISLRLELQARCETEKPRTSRAITVNLRFSAT